jgi:hypothetical protein
VPEVRRRSRSSSAGEVPDHQFDKLGGDTQAGRHLREGAAAAADARSVQLTRQVLRTAGSPHPCGTYGSARPARMRDSTALCRRSLIRPHGRGPPRGMRIGGPGRARLSLVRQSPLLRGRFSFQDGVISQSRQPESFTESEAPRWYTSGPLVRSHAGHSPGRWPLSSGPTTIFCVLRPAAEPVRSQRRRTGAGTTAPRRWRADGRSLCVR